MKPFFPLVQRVRTLNAFTLIEMIIVITILAAVAMIALPSLIGQSDKAKSAQVRTDITNAHRAAAALWRNGPPDNMAEALAESEPSLKIEPGSSYINNHVYVESLPGGGFTLRTTDGMSNYVRMFRPGEGPFVAQVPVDEPASINLVKNASGESGTFTSSVISSTEGSTTKIVDSDSVFGSKSFEKTIHDVAAVTATGNWDHHGTIHFNSQVSFPEVGDVNGAYTASGYVKAPKGTRIRITQYRRVNGVFNYHPDFIKGGKGSEERVTGYADSTGDWQRVSITLDPYTGSGVTDLVNFRIGFVDATGLNDGDAFLLDGVMLTQTPKLQLFFDGTFPDALWKGTPFISESFGPNWRAW